MGPSAADAGGVAAATGPVERLNVDLDAVGDVTLAPGPAPGPAPAQSRCGVVDSRFDEVSLRVGVAALEPRLDPKACVGAGAGTRTVDVVDFEAVLELGLDDDAGRRSPLLRVVVLVVGVVVLRLGLGLRGYTERFESGC